MSAVSALSSATCARPGWLVRTERKPGRIGLVPLCYQSPRLGLSPASSASTRVESMSPPLRSPSPSPVVSPSASLARSPSRAFSTCPNTIVRHALPKTFTSVSHGTHISISPTPILLHCSSVSISSALLKWALFL